MKKIAICLILIVSFKGKSQDVGKIVIKNSFNQPFIVSLNGVRINNAYSLKTTFDNLDETNYNAKFLFSGSSTPLIFGVNSSVKYESVYVLMKDQNGAYSIMLESKTLLTANSNTLASSGTNSTVINTVYIGQPITEADYVNMEKMLSDASIESSRLEMAKTFLHNRSITCEQLKGFLKTFFVDHNKVEYAKFAYSKTADKQNIYKLYDVFSFSSSKKEISDFINNSK